MQIRDWMTEQVEVAHPDDDVASVRVRLDRRRIRQLPVVVGGMVVGIITDRDVRATRDPAARVSTVMTSDPITTSPSARIEDAASILRQCKIGALPVVERGALVGIVSESDLLEALIEFARVLEPTTLLEVECDDGLHETQRVRSVLERHGVEVLWMRTACEPDGRVHLALRVRSPLGHVPEQVLEEAGFRVSACIAGARQATQPNGSDAATVPTS
jgi:acetoin utilization protein AcuB